MRGIIWDAIDLLMDDSSVRKNCKQTFAMSEPDVQKSLLSRIEKFPSLCLLPMHQNLLINFS